MASTIQLSRTIALAQQFIRLSPLTFASNTNNDPAFSNADWVMQTILAPPFAWRWNRVATSVEFPTFVTIPGISNYNVVLSDFGWIEKAVTFDPNSGYASYELQNEMIVGIDQNANQPTRISALLDNDSGQIQFRLFPTPDKQYNVCVDYQKAAPLFTTTNQTWAPIPDYMSFIYNLGFRAMAYEYMNDPRWTTSMQLFLQQLVGMSEGLSQSQKNLWLEDKLNTLRQTQLVQAGRG